MRFKIHNPTRSLVHLPEPLSGSVPPQSTIVIDTSATNIDTPVMRRLTNAGVLRVLDAADAPAYENNIEIPVIGFLPTGGGGGGITESEHEDLDTLTHELVEDSVTDFVYSGSRVTGTTVWTNVGRTTKIRETAFTYTGARLTQSVTTQYNGAGASLYTLTKDFSYTGSNVTLMTTIRA